MLRMLRRALPLFSVALVSLLVASTAARRGGLTPEESAYYFDLFSYTAAVCPLESWRQTKDSLATLYRGDGTHELAEDVYGAIRADLPVLKAVWQNGSVILSAPSQTPLQVTRTVERFVLLELSNQGPELTFSAAFAGMPASNLATIPPGETYALLTRVTVKTDPGPSLVLTVRAQDGLGGAAQDALTVSVALTEPVTLTGVVRESGQPFPGRVWIKGSDGVLRHGWAPHARVPTLSLKNVFPVTAGAPHERVDYKLPFFYSGPGGELALKVPPGKTEIRLERGYEHEIVTEIVSAAAGDWRHIELDSPRFIDMLARGWISGDTHVHWSINDQTEDEAYDLLDLVQKAEDVRVVNNLTLRGSKPDHPDFTAPDDFAPGLLWDDGKGQICYQAEEWRNNGGYGHLNLLNLSELIPPISTGPDLMYMLDEQYDWPMNSWAMEQARNQINPDPLNGLRGVVLSAHGLDGWFVADLAMGLADGLDQLNPKHYYRILNCGFEVPLTMGADHPSRLVGEARTYVKIPDPSRPSYRQWIGGLLDKRTFVTSGPLLFLRATAGNQGAGVGESLRVSSADVLHIEAEAFSRDAPQHHLQHLQIVSNDQILASAEIGSSHGLVTVDVPVGESRWIVARCGKAGSYCDALIEPDAAHTSAIYVYADGDARIFPDPSDAEAFRDLCSSIADDVRSGAILALEQPWQRPAAEAYLRAAAQVYEDLIQTYGR